MPALTLLVLIGTLVVTMVFGRVLRRSIKRIFEVRSNDLCVCGYLLRGLDVARCPECGRVTNFNATPEELGLSRDQLASIELKRR